MIKIKQTNKKKHRKGTKTRNDTWSTIVAIKKKTKQNCIGRPSLKRQRCKVGLSV